MAGQLMCEQLALMGVPISRVHVLVRTLHPLYHGHSFMWRRDEGIKERDWSHGLQEEPGWRQSVFFELTEGSADSRFHFDLRDPEAGANFPMMQDLRSEGVTGYIAFRLCFSDGSFQAASFATDSPDGFSEADLDLLFGLERVLAVRLETAIRRELAEVVLGTYLGRNAARRVLKGDIRRGDMETISSAIWMSDLRGFTEMSDRLPAETLLELLGDYFDAVVTAVREEGGEVLKFIGDAVLAVFRVGPSSAAAACEAAARTAVAVETRLAELNRTRHAAGKPVIRHGVGLHFGEVNYGNVGSPERLDFTVIGPAVNMTSRIEGLCGSLNQTVLMSEDFASHLSQPTQHLGEHQLKGLREPVVVHGLPGLIRQV